VGWRTPTVCEYDRVSDEAEIENAVDDCDVYIPENANRLCNDHNEGSAEVDFEKSQKVDCLVVVARPCEISKSASSFQWITFG